MSLKQQAAGQAVQHTTAFAGSKLATGMTYGGGATAFVGGLTLNEFAIVFGMVIGLLGFCLQIYPEEYRKGTPIFESRRAKP